MKYDHIIFDFDGVLVESNHIRFDGFKELFKQNRKNEIEAFIAFAKVNGGMSRYEKICYFYKEVIKTPINDSEVHKLAGEYSRLVMNKVINCKAVEGSIDFLSKYNKMLSFAVVTGADQEETIEVCKKRGIMNYFVRILGSPENKENNLQHLVISENWNKSKCLYVGDSMNDMEAAIKAEINFLGRQSGLVDWSSIGIRAMKSIMDIEEELNICKRGIL